MLRMAKTEVSLHVDPKPMERVTWQRLKVVVEHEACHRDWGCALYTLHRTGRIDNEQREAGDRYASLITDYRKLWRDPIGFSIDVPNQERDYDIRCKETQLTEQALGLALAESIRDDLSDFETKRAKRISLRYKDAMGIAGPINRVLEELLIDEVWPAGELEHRAVSHALTRLSHFFSTGTKRKHGVR
jgi:hypothetical protein